MSFFKEFKEDLSTAVNELLPEEEQLEENKDLLQDEELLEDSDESIDLDDFDNLLKAVGSATEEEEKLAEEDKIEEEIEEELEEIQEEVEENVEVIPETFTPVVEELVIESKDEENSISEDAAVITKGTTIKGDIESNGSLEIVGTVTGNVICSGKLTITGKVTGSSTANEIFADAARVEGEVMSEGTVKIGVGSIIIGNVTATSAVIAGAVNGDIDVKGPVIIDSSAVIMGDIKSKSVQINNGAIIEGYVSQCYSDVDVKAFFEDNK